MATAKPQPAAPKAKKRKKAKAFLTKARVYIKATYNNTLVTVTDSDGNVVAWSSAGSQGFKGPKKSTPYAAGVVVRNVLEKIKDSNVKEIEILVKGVGAGREGAIRAFNAQGISILSIKDVTPIPHNGPRPRKVRRI